MGSADKEGIQSRPLVIEDELLRVQQSPEDVFENVALLIRVRPLRDGGEELLLFLRGGAAAEHPPVEGVDDFRVGLFPGNHILDDFPLPDPLVDGVAVDEVE